jgi:hypothetical protein
MLECKSRCNAMIHQDLLHINATDKEYTKLVVFTLGMLMSAKRRVLSLSYHESSYLFDKHVDIFERCLLKII